MKKRVKNKDKGQVSVFIIIAIILVILIVLFFIFRNSLISTNNNSQSDFNRIYSSLKYCINNVAEGAINQIGQTGGYYITNFSTRSNVSYYYYYGNNYMPSKETISRELSQYMDNHLAICIDNLNLLNITNTSYSQIKTNSKIEDNRVIFNVDLPITLTFNEKTYSYKNFNDIIVNNRLGLIYDSIVYINKDMEENPHGVCLNCVYDIARKNELKIDMYDYDDETVIFLIQDKNSTISGEAYMYLFANKYKQK